MGWKMVLAEIELGDWIVLAMGLRTAIVTYFLLEKPFSRLKRRFTFVANHWPGPETFEEAHNPRK